MQVHMMEIFLIFAMARIKMAYANGPFDTGIY